MNRLSLDTKVSGPERSFEEIRRLFPKSELYSGSSYLVKKLEGRDFAICYVGGWHSSDPNDLLYTQLRDTWNQELNVSHILTEVSNQLPPDVRSVESAVNIGIEAGFLQYLARLRDQEIQWVPMDISSLDRIKALIDLGVDAKEILIYEVFRRISSAIKVDKIESLNDEFLLNTYKEKSSRFTKLGISIPISLEEMMRDYPEMFDIHYVDYDWASPIAEYNEPEVASIVSRIVHLSHDLRDVHMVQTVLDCAHSGNRLFVLATHFHLWKQWEAIEKMLV